MCTGQSIYLEGRSVLKMSVYKYHLPSTLFQTTTYLTRKNTHTVTLGHVYTHLIYTYCYTAGREGMNTANAYCHRTANCSNSHHQQLYILHLHLT